MKNSDLKMALENLTLNEVLLKKHGLNGPSTFRRNNSKHPIDGIWASPNICLKAGGYFAYDDVFLNTDHRCLWLDISFENAFGHNMPAIIRPQARRLHCKDPRLVANYVKTYRSFLVKKHIPKKLRRLKERVSHPMTAEDKSWYEEIDLERCKGVMLAEKKCRKLRMGQVSFSPVIQQASRTIRAWDLLEKKAKGIRTSSRLLSRSLNKAKLPPESRGLPLEKIRKNSQEAYKAYYVTKGSHKELRDSHTEQLVEAIAEAGNTTKEKVIKVIRHREKQQFTARKIKFLRGKLSRGSTTMVTIQQEDGTFKDITGKRNIEDAIIASNNLKFQQSFHTPFMQPPL